jgi:hypothetical protein
MNLYIKRHCDMTPERRNSSLLGNGSVNIPVEAKVHNNRRAMFSVVRATWFAMQQCTKHICAAVHQHAKIEEVVFSVGEAPRGYITRIS